MKVSTGCPELDALLRGGLDSGAITEFYGEAGTGKTSICMQIARGVCSSGKKVVYIDTEGLSADRLEQVCGSELAKGILLFEPYDFDEQDKDVEKAAKLAQSNRDVGLVILDSATMHYRVDMRSEMERSERKSLNTQLTHLLRVARSRDIPVLITSQVYTDIETNEYKPLGGHVLHHNAKTIIKLEKVEGGKRRAILMKHRAIPEGGSVDFVLTDKGIDGCPGMGAD
ncbi:MAG: DNA repair and recombination protein RadB [Euryarchaeota archaeon]|nr:DNA repair and recombination protein RadB [Euryarchaeota archaeon]